MLVALDPKPTEQPLRYALRDAVRKFAHSEPHAYFTFLSVVERAREAKADKPGPVATSPAIQCLAEMRNWAQPLHLRSERVHFQVIPGVPVAALIEYLQTHAIDHVILGARVKTGVDRLLGSVSYRVMRQAPCSVTVVRTGFSSQQPLQDMCKGETRDCLSGRSAEYRARLTASSVLSGLILICINVCSGTSLLLY